MSSYFILYLCSIADALDNLMFFLAIGGIIGIFGSIIGSLIYWSDVLSCEGSFLELIKKPLKVLIPVTLIFGFITSVIPNSKACYAIFGIGTTLEYIKSNKELKKIPDNAFKAINYYLESIPNDSIK